MEGEKELVPLFVGEERIGEHKHLEMRARRSRLERC